MKTFQKPLTSKEEVEYLRLLREGDSRQAKEAKSVLVERNLRLVAHVARKYQNTGEEMEDLISTGCIGLIKAIDTFDAGKGRLATYACRCIDNELLMLLRSKKKLSREVFLFDSIGQDKEGNEIRLLDVIEQKPYDIAKEMDLSNDIQKLYQYVEECLTPREKKILIMRYGLGGSREMTQNEIGESLNISRSYVSRIEKRAVEKLKKSLGITDYRGNYSKI